MNHPVEFWYEFASTYSYISALRIEDEAKARGIQVNWKPFLLGPIFQSQGWDNSPFNIYPAKGRYMWRDMERRCQKFGLAFKKPEVFPVHSVRAARLALLGMKEGWGEDYSKRVYRAQFAEGRDIADPTVLAEILSDMTLDGPNLLEASNSPNIKTALRKQTEEASDKGIFGAPSFWVGGEMFWGDDRLEEALDWALKA